MSVAFFCTSVIKEPLPTFPLIVSDRLQPPIPPKFLPSSLFTSKPALECMANADAFNASLLQRQRQDPTNQEKSRAQYLDNWSLQWEKDEKKADAGGSTSRALSIRERSPLQRNSQPLSRTLTKNTKGLPLSFTMDSPMTPCLSEHTTIQYGQVPLQAWVWQSDLYCDWRIIWWTTIPSHG